MSAKQPEALRLADVLETHYDIYVDPVEAASELRRLHALNVEWHEKAATWLASPEAAQRLAGYQDLAQRLNAAEQQRDELLEALKACDEAMSYMSEYDIPLTLPGQVKAAIDKAIG